MIYKEQPSLRDILASQIIGSLLNNSKIEIDLEKLEERQIKYTTRAAIKSLAFLAYSMADALLEERIKEHKD